MSPTTSPTKAITEEALDRFWETVPPVWGQVRAHIRATATERFPITVEQFQVLRLIRTGKASVSEIATARNISRPAVSQAVDVLVNSGMLTRTQATEDRRHVDLALTKAGNELLDVVFSDARAWMREKMADFSEKELDEIVRGLRLLKRMME